MIDTIVDFTHALRSAGIPVALSETLDAVSALEHLDARSSEILRSTLAATTVKDQSQRARFDTIFDLYFLPHRGDDTTADVPTEEFRDEVMQALASGSGAEGLEGLAGRAVEALGRVPDSPSDSLYFEYPVLRALDLEALRRTFEETLEGMSPIDALAARQTFDERSRSLRERIRRQVRRRVAYRKGPERVIRHAVRPLPQDADLMSMSAEDIAALRKAIRPLARKLATRLAMKHKRARRGLLDVRRTVRHSLSTGGVPFDTYLRKRVPHRPEVFVLCDVSDSVARFSRFSLMLVHALALQFSKVRSFAFVDTLDEVTRFFDHEDFVSAIDRMNREARVVSFDGHSDYGNSFETFLEEHGSGVTPRTTILVLGDARNNFRAPRGEALGELADRAHRTYWLNPEPVMFWDTGDSAASSYMPYLDDMVEVRNLRQLESFIARTL